MLYNQYKYVNTIKEKIKCRTAIKPTKAKHVRHPKTMIIINDFIVEYNTKIGFYLIVSCETISCPCCSGILKPRGKVKRIVIEKPNEKLDEKRTYVLQRYICNKCKKCHRELPNFIVPYKRHCTDTIQTIITSTEKHPDVNYEEETVKRIRTWWTDVRPYIIGALLSIKEKYDIDFTYLDPSQNLAKIVRALVNANLWPCTRSVLLTDP